MGYSYSNLNFFQVLLALCLVSLAVCEPPVPSNQYLPANNGFGSPSSAYGAPAPNSQYGTPNAPSQQYGAPNGGLNGGSAQRPSSNYGAPARTPSSSYGAPNAVTAAIIQPNSQYGVPNAGSAGYSAGGDNGYNYGNAGNGGNGGYDDGASVSFTIYTIHGQGSRKVFMF